MMIRSTSIAALIVSSVLMSGCGSETATTASPTGHVAQATDATPAAARDRSQARFPDQTPKQFEQQDGWRKFLTFKDVREFLGEPVIPQQGQFAGWWIYPNLCFDGTNVRSLMVRPRMGGQPLDTDPISVKWIEYLSPEALAQWQKPGE